MNLTDLQNKLGLKALTSVNSDNNDATGCYICDLLSLVMSNAGKGDIWITVQTSINTIAVATLTEVSCVIIPENISIEELTLKKAEDEGITVFSSEKTSFELAKTIGEYI